MNINNAFVFLLEEVDLFLEEKSMFFLKEDEKLSLEKIIRSRKIERGIADRARIILWSSFGISAKEIARRLGVLTKTVVYWQSRFLKDKKNGLPGCLCDLPRSGRPTKWQV